MAVVHPAQPGYALQQATEENLSEKEARDAGVVLPEKPEADRPEPKPKPKAHKPRADKPKPKQKDKKLEVKKLDVSIEKE